VRQRVDDAHCRGGPDTTRPALTGSNVIGVFTSPGSRLVGEMAGEAMTQMVENECWLSVEQTVLGDDLSYWQSNDRVFMPDRDEWYTINYIGPSSTFRPLIHLSRLQEVDEP
jgi:hypothetical protein